MARESVNAAGAKTFGWRRNLLLTVLSLGIAAAASSAWTTVDTERGVIIVGFEDMRR